MGVKLPRNFEDLRRYLRDPLYKNSIFIMLTSFSAAGFGLIFWMLAAKLYTQEDVGIATALISSMGLLILISRLGLDKSVVKFFPKRDKSRVLGTALISTTIVAVAAGIFFILTIDVWSPELKIITSIAPIYLIFLTAYSITWIIGDSFNAIRKSEYYFLLNFLFGTRVIFLFPLVIMGALGIFCSFGIAFILGLIFSFILLFKSGIKLAGMDWGFLRDSLHFSAGNYIAGLLMASPQMILPIMVLNVLGAIESANYYIAYALVSILFMIPQAFTTSLFVEGSHGEALKSNVLKSLFGIYSLLIPAVLVISILGEFLLGLIGSGYAAGVDILRILSISSLFMPLCQTYITIKMVQDDIKNLILISIFIFVLLIGFSYIFMLRFGLIGVGYAWIATYLLGGLVIGLMMRREKWVLKRKIPSD